MSKKKNRKYADRLELAKRIYLESSLCLLVTRLWKFNISNRTEQGVLPPILDFRWLLPQEVSESPHKVGEEESHNISRMESYSVIMNVCILSDQLYPISKHRPRAHKKFEQVYSTAKCFTWQETDECMIVIIHGSLDPHCSHVHMPPTMLLITIHKELIKHIVYKIFS